MWTEGKHKGYSSLKLSKDIFEVSFVYLNTIKSEVYEVIDSNKFNVRPNTQLFNIIYIMRSYIYYLVITNLKLSIINEVRL